MENLDTLKTIIEKMKKQFTDYPSGMNQKGELFQLIAQAESLLQQESVQKYNMITFLPSFGRELECTAMTEEEVVADLDEFLECPESADMSMMDVRNLSIFIDTWRNNKANDEFVFSNEDRIFIQPIVKE